MARRYVDALAERARAGVEVRVTLDYIGSLAHPGAICKRCSMPAANSAGTTPCEVRFIPQFNNRTHRELLIVDGSTAFIGGAGVADWWMQETASKVNAGAT